MGVEVENLLMPGETIVWKGAPNYNKAKPEATAMQAKLKTALWMVGFAVALTCVLWIASLPQLEGLPRTILGVVAVGLIIALLIAAIATFTSQPVGRPNERYYVTDRRLIIIDDDKDDRASFFPGAMLGVRSHPNGATRNVVVDHGHDETNYRMLHALEDADSLERLLIDTLSTRKVAP